MKRMQKERSDARRQQFPASSDEWPNHDETWLEFMARQDGPCGQYRDGVCTVLFAVVLAVVVVCLIIDAYDQATGRALM